MTENDIKRVANEIKIILELDFIEYKKNLLYLNIS